MAKTFHLTIAKVGENLFDGEAVSARLPGADGIFTVLAHHEPMVSTLGMGEAQVEAADGQTFRYEIAKGGIAEISNNQATILL
ncbi:MAG TPA: F0F1 ATP synthase subunit epsilon [Candidatus Paceibacterota bacterium]|nr:F0F1 ATP synthase subunit epsilon [Candidatus Paceibacterota bacterium]